jgi:hypothetical protein
MAPYLRAIRQALASRSYLLTEHASDRAVARNIASHEIEEAVQDAVLVEDYPADKYGPSCLLMGKTATDRTLHIQVSYPSAIKVITVYEPSASEWQKGWVARRTR